MTKQHAVDMYYGVHSGLTFERAILEVTRHIGWLAQARYERLVEGIGDVLELPPARIFRPVWNGKVLFFQGKAIRSLRQPEKAARIKAVLDAFEGAGWRLEVALSDIGSWSAHDMSDTLRRLRDGLSCITFEMNGSGTGVIWRPV